MTMAILLRRRDRVLCVRRCSSTTDIGRLGTAADGGRTRLSGRTRAQQPVDVEGAEREDEGVDGAEDDQRDRRRARRQERRHGVGGPQNAIDHPGLTADLGREPAGQ